MATTGDGASKIRLRWRFSTAFADHQTLATERCARYPQEHVTVFLTLDRSAGFA
jgi:hypothetical protein